MNIPNEWKYKEVQKNEDESSYEYALKLYKNIEEQYAMLYIYNNQFGVCGTGRTSKNITLNNGNEATVGYYDGNKNWSDISFYSMNKNMAVINYGLIDNDAEEVIEFLRILRACEVRVIFVDDGLDSFKDSDTLMIELFAALSQAENNNRSEAIRWGHEKRARQGQSKFYNRKVYGYKNDSKGNLIIDEYQAENVKLIFSLYLARLSLLKIIRELEKRKIKSPKEKETWSKRSIDTMLSNEKYTGRVILLKNNNSAPSYEFKEHHEAIISEEIFEEVQLEKQRRSNLENGNRKSSKFSSKKPRQE